MRFSDLFSSKIIPFEAVITREGETIGLVTGKASSSFITVGNMNLMAGVEGISDISSAVNTLLVEAVVSWSIEDEDGSMLPPSEAHRLPLDCAIQILGGIISAVGGQPPSFMKDMV